MPDEIAIKPRTESTSTATRTENAPAAATTADKPKATPDLSPYLILCAAGLFASFFMPWVTILFGHPSGFDLQKLGDLHWLYWTIPFFSAFAIVAGLTKNSQRAIAHIAGAVPYAILICWLIKFESNYAKLLENLDFGAYIALICGAALNILARWLK